LHLGTTRRLLAAVSVIALAIAACSSAQSSPSLAAAAASQAGATGGTAVAVKLEEWTVKPATDSVAAGNVTFEVTNAGPNNAHEFVILKTELDPAALPTGSSGIVSETAAGIEVLGEIEDMAIGANRKLTVPLAAGKYALVCNLYDAGAHYKAGMWTAFTVTE
jgi:uncharacterized cupredoxin-like copper-binding protein